MTKIHSYLEALMLADENPLRFAPGQLLFTEGEPGDQMFIVRTGSVELRHGGHVLETVAPGGMVGEMALIDASPRSATAVASADCSVAAVDEATFHTLVQRVPGLALELLRILARRLRHTTRRTSAARKSRGPGTPRKPAARTARKARR